MLLLSILKESLSTSKLKSKYPEKKITLADIFFYRFAHVNLGNLTQNEYVEKIFKNRNYVNGLNKVRVLIVDEISMLDGGLLDKIEYICRTVRRNVEKPFGGIRVCSSIIKEKEAYLSFKLIRLYFVEIFFNYRPWIKAINV